MTEQKNRAGYCSLAALRYAEVLYQLKVPEEAIGETKRLWEVSEELPEVLSNPAVSKEQKHGIIDRIFPKEMRSFLTTKRPGSWKKSSRAMKKKSRQQKVS